MTSMNLLLRAAILTVSVSSFSAACASLAHASSVEGLYDQPTLDIGGSVNPDGGTADIRAMYPLIFSEQKDLYFLGGDLKAYKFDIKNLDETVYNAGAYLGYRHLLDDGAGVLGLWAGVDNFQTYQGNFFTRGIVGAEYFGEHLLLRGNYFMPFDSTSKTWSVTNPDGSINDMREYAPHGFDIDAGLRFPVDLMAFTKKSEFRAHLGTYGFFGLADDGGDIFGGRVRLGLDVYPFFEHPETKLTLNGSMTYDKQAGEQYDAGLMLSIPIGAKNKLVPDGPKDSDLVEMDTFEKDLFQPVIRNQSITTKIETIGTTPAPCGGLNSPLPLTDRNFQPLVSPTITAGATVGYVIDSSGNRIRPIVFDPLSMVVDDGTPSGGMTLAQLLATRPTTLNVELKFPPSLVNFMYVAGKPNAHVAESFYTTQVPWTPLNSRRQYLHAFSLIMNGNQCSVEMEVIVRSNEGAIG